MAGEPAQPVLPGLPGEIRRACAGMPCAPAGSSKTGGSAIFTIRPQFVGRGRLFYEYANGIPAAKNR